jgi:hypothetical protein
MSPDRPSSSTSDRRTSERREFEAPVRMTFEIEGVEGTTDNLSSAGLLFYTENPIRVRVQIEHEGGSKSFQGRLIRALQMDEETTGLAVEFDEN